MERICLGNPNQNTNFNSAFVDANNNNRNSENNFIKGLSEVNKIIFPTSTDNKINQNVNNQSSINEFNNNKNNNNQKRSPIIISHHANNNNSSFTSNNSNFNSGYFSEPNNNNNINNISSNTINYPPSLLRKIKQIENILSQKLVNITELRSIAWKGLPYGKNKLI